MTTSSAKMATRNMGMWPAGELQLCGCGVDKAVELDELVAAMAVDSGDGGLPGVA